MTAQDTQARLAPSYPTSLADIVRQYSDAAIMARLDCDSAALDLLRRWAAPRADDNFAPDVATIAGVTGVDVAALADLIRNTPAPTIYWLTTPQAASLLGVKQRRIQQLVAGDELRGAKIGRALYIQPASAEAYARKDRASRPNAGAPKKARE